MNATYPPSRSTRSAVKERSGDRKCFGVRGLLRARSAAFAPAMDPPLWMDAVSSASVEGAPGRASAGTEPRRFSLSVESFESFETPFSLPLSLPREGPRGFGTEQGATFSGAETVPRFFFSAREVFLASFSFAARAAARERVAARVARAGGTSPSPSKVSPSPSASAVASSGALSFSPPFRGDVPSASSSASASASAAFSLSDFRASASSSSAPSTTGPGASRAASASNASSPGLVDAPTRPLLRGPPSSTESVPNPSASTDGNKRRSATGFHASGHPSLPGLTTRASSVEGMAFPAASARAWPSPPAVPGMPAAAGGGRAMSGHTSSTGVSRERSVRRRRFSAREFCRLR